MLYHRRVDSTGFSFLSLITDYKNAIIKTKGCADDMQEGLILAGNFLLSELAGMTEFTTKIIAGGSIGEVYIYDGGFCRMQQFSEGLVGCLFGLLASQ